MFRGIDALQADQDEWDKSGIRKCPKCFVWKRLRNDGKFPRHKLPRQSFQTSKSLYCPASGTLLSDWKREI